MADAWQTLEKLLTSLGESSQFVTSGSVPPVLPGLEVKGVGSIGSPTSPADAKRLIAKATQAPYGRGEETIVDKKVRRVWQIEPSSLAFRNAEWNAHITAIVDAVKAGIQHRRERYAQTSTSCSSTRRAVSSPPIATRRKRRACLPRWSCVCRRTTKAGP